MVFLSTNRLFLRVNVFKIKAIIGTFRKEHFGILLNHKGPIYRSALELIPNEIEDNSLAQIPSLEEINADTVAMKNYKFTKS